MASISPTLPKGANFIRYAIARAVSGSDGSFAAEFAAMRWGEESAAARVCKAAVPAGAIKPGEAWGPELAAYANAMREFFEAVKQQTVLDRLPGVRRTSMYVRTLTQGQKLSASFVGQGKPVPMSRLSFAADTLEPLMVAGITAATSEMVKNSSPRGEDIIRKDLTRALAEAVDLALLDPSNAGVIAEAPASITHGINPLTVPGGDMDDVKGCFEAMVARFAGDLTRAVVIGRPELFVRLSGLLNFPNVGARGGEMAGIPAVPSTGLPNADDGSCRLVLVDPTGIALAEDQAQIAVSTSGTIEMLDDALQQDALSSQGANLVSLFQVNAIGFLGKLFVNWKVARPGSVSMIDGIPPAEAPAS